MSCPDCFRGGKATGEPKGEFKTLYGLQTYVAGGATIENISGSTIIYYPDAFGVDFINNKVLADAYAAGTGCRVLVPDIIPGGSMSSNVLPLMDQIMAPVSLFNIWGHIKRVFSTLRAMSYAVPFMYRAWPGYEVCNKACLEYARKVKADMPPSAKLGVCGFCWGGNQSLRVSAQPTFEGGSERLIDAQFCAHPSAIKAPNDIVNAVTKFKTAVAIAHASEDFGLPMQKIEESEAALRQAAGDGRGENGFNYEVKIYQGIGHGFAVRAVPGNKQEAVAADEAKEQAIAWFNKFL